MAAIECLLLFQALVAVFASKSARAPGKTTQNPAATIPCDTVDANGTLCEPAQSKAAVAKGHLKDTTPFPYRKNPIVWTHCLGNKNN